MLINYYSMKSALHENGLHRMKTASFPAPLTLTNQPYKQIMLHCKIKELLFSSLLTWSFVHFGPQIILCYDDVTDWLDNFLRDASTSVAACFVLFPFWILIAPPQSLKLIFLWCHVQCKERTNQDSTCNFCPFGVSFKGELSVLLLTLTNQNWVIIRLSSSL